MIFKGGSVTLDHAQVKILYAHWMGASAIAKQIGCSGGAVYKVLNSGGAEAPEVALISGHRGPRMLSRYTHLRLDKVAEKLAKATVSQHSKEKSLMESTYRLLSSSEGSIKVANQRPSLPLIPVT
jgi:hypothetical protein